MKAKELVQEMKEDFNEDKEDCVRKVLKDKLYELQNAQSVVATLQRQYDNLLEKTVDEIFYDDDM